MIDAILADELQPQFEAATRRRERVVASMARVLALDLSSWVKSRGREAFIAHELSCDEPETVDVGALKGAVLSLASSASHAALDTLCSTEVWRTDREGRDDLLGRFPHVQQVISRWEERLISILKAQGLYVDRARYIAPRYFVDGLHLPTLLEEFWRIDGELNSLERIAEEAVIDRRRARIAARWDAAG